jgi:CDP-diacylglycerol--serine O-phosphatidyltransferase
MSVSGSKKRPSSRWKRRRERAQKGLSILPSLLTLGNGICGIAAIIKVAKIQWGPTVTEASPYFWAINLREAALLILLGMVFDMLDGRVARLTRTTSDFGGQLDSLSDAITFGVAPGVMTIMANAEARFTEHHFWTKVAWVFGIAYACGAIARLARFNVENDHDEKAHQEFKGLPSPAAAGVIATLILLQSYLLGTGSHAFPALPDTSWLTTIGTDITFVLPFVALGLGYLMVSKFRYVHLANRYLKGRKPFWYLRVVFVAGVCLALLPEVFGALAFGIFALTGPVLAWRTRLLGPAAPPATETPTAPLAAAPAQPATPPATPPVSQPATGI